MTPVSASLPTEAATRLPEVAKHNVLGSTSTPLVAQGRQDIAKHNILGSTSTAPVAKDRQRINAEWIEVSIAIRSEGLAMICADTDIDFRTLGNCLPTLKAS
jgi:hypothetical protein